MTSTQARFREFPMPDVGEGLTEAEILKWYVQPGDTVSDGQVVCEVETAKAAVELPIPFDGAVAELRFDEGTTVDVGTSIITVDTDPSAGDATPPPTETGAEAGGSAEAGGAAATVEAAAGEEPQAAGDAESDEGEKRQAVLVGYGVAASSTKRRPRKPQPGQTAVPQAAAPAAAQEAVQGELNGQGQPSAAPTPGTALNGGAGTTASEAGSVGGAPGTAATAEGGRPLAKPPVRKLAKDLGVDLATVTPTGEEGIITRDDVHAAAAAPAVPRTERATAAAPPAQPAEPTTVPPGAGAHAARETRVPVKGVRKATAAAMVDSAFTAPHVTEFVTVDVTRTMKLVRELKQDPDMAGLRVNPLLLVARAFLLAIRRHPEVNAAWDEANQEIVRKHYVNLGIAAATPRGLVVPNVKDAHERTLPELAASLGELIATARDGKTAPADMQGGTVTITNVGVFGVDSGTPILNPGESAILAFGQVRDTPWVHKGKVKPRKVTTLALSFDHRLVDGELGSKVLADIGTILEQPKKLITWS